MKHKLTTIDNPFDVFNDYESWLAFDEQSGYFTNALLARVSSYSNELSELDQDSAVEDAIDDIILNDLFNIYKKVSRPSVGV